MEMNLMKVQSPGKIIGLIFTLIGLMFIGLGIILTSVNLRFLEDALETTAIITDIETYKTTKGSRRHRVYVEFSVDGETYDGRLGEYHSGMKVGDTVTIYYDPDNPADFRGSGVGYAGYILMAIGAVSLIACASAGLISLGRKKSRQLLLETGQRVEANIDVVYLNKNVHVNGRHPFVIRCTYMDPVTRKVYTFTSENLWFSVDAILKSTGIKSLPVYMDHHDPAKYYVDINPLKAYLGN